MKKQTNFRLDPDILDALLELKKLWKCSTTAVIVRLINEAPKKELPKP